ncbi:MAG: response regulator, partial [Thermoflexales bacterium]|nr:response regulator [Thermoflexales bacterium]
MSKVMIVDDSMFMRNNLCKLLTQNGYETVTAADGQQAVDAYRSSKPDLVLMDITMPVMNGMDALAQIRILDPQAQVIMLTALDQQLIAARAVHMGAKDFLVKPVPPAMLL